ncbi:LysE family translocator [Psychromonas sp. KJ10-10]|uniref:LysE family translocator n=1 Tax=Psychromonas sp. KJ10-10 TaxID=3391823 RepID=UPI0039B5B287
MTLSATSLSIILATSAVAFTILKFVGAGYLIYLGIKQWHSSSSKMDPSKAQATQGHLLKFRQGFLITMTNPKTIFFFMALFPQFIDHDKSYLSQFILLSVTFCVLMVIIHSLYGLFSMVAKSKLSSPKGSRIIGKVSGSFYMLFGVGLATTSK